MITISLCMIVKDEEAVLARCLDSVKEAVDEIIIVDTGSADNTKAIAGKYTDKVYDFEWIDDFAAARNEAFSKATMDYQMWLDADDVISPQELEKLQNLKKTLARATDIVTMKYITHFDPQGHPIHSSTRGRLFKRDKGFAWQDPIHEHIPLGGTVLHCDMEIHHKKNHKEGQANRNIDIYNKLEASRKPLSPRQQYYFARELKDHGQWAKAVYYFEKFLDSGLGWVEDNVATCHSLAICYEVMNDREKILPILTKSFLYDAPRAEICTEIGYYYKRAVNYLMAYQWFRLAANLGKPKSAGFILQDHWGYIPNIECCVCCCALGDIESAKMYNERAAAYKPDSLAVRANRKALSTVR